MWYITLPNLPKSLKLTKGSYFIMQFITRILGPIRSRAHSNRVRKTSNVVCQSSFLLEGRELLSAAVVPSSLKPSVHVANNHGNQPQSVTPRRWQWLVDTYWYVPNRGLPAIIFTPSTGEIVKIPDQTVYHISGYKNGYFWGETVAQYGGSAPSSAALIGSVTPEGKLLLSFNTGASTTQGFGSMTRKNGQWTMENQMFTGSASSQVGHWAYMVQTKPGMKSWNSLPFVNQSVPTFLSNYSLPKPTPVN